MPPRLLASRLAAHIAAVALLLPLITAAPRAGAEPAAPGHLTPLDLSASYTPSGRDINHLGAEQGAGPRLALATYVGGPASDYARAVAVDSSGNIFLALDSFSKRIFGSDVANQGGRDVVVLKLSPDGRTILDGVAFGSVSSDEVLAMAVTPAGEPVLTISPGEAWPTERALRPEPTWGNEGVLVKLNAALDAFVFSTYVHANLSNQGGQNLALDRDGNIYVTGDRYVAETRARDLIVQKFSPDGQRLVYERILNDDDSSELGRALAVGPDGSAYVTGVVSNSHSTLAVTPDALQKLCGTHLAGRTNFSCGDDGFLIILDPAGAVRYASYLGGDGADSGVDIAVDGLGGIAIIGATSATDFPTTQGALIPRCKVSGSPESCYYDTFLTRLSPDGRTITYSTFLNSNDPDSMEFTAQLAADAQGNVTVVGITSGEAFPTKDPVQGTLAVRPCASVFTRFCYDTFIATFGPDNSLRFGSYLGGTSDEQTEDVTLGPDGSLYVTGVAESWDYPVSAGAPQPKLAGGADAFLARISIQSPGDAIPPGPFRAYLPLIRR